MFYLNLEPHVKCSRNALTELKYTIPVNDEVINLGVSFISLKILWIVMNHKAPYHRMGTASALTSIARIENSVFKSD